MRCNWSSKVLASSQFRVQENTVNAVKNVTANRNKKDRSLSEKLTQKLQSHCGFARWTSKCQMPNAKCTSGIAFHQICSWGQQHCMNVFLFTPMHKRTNGKCSNCKCTNAQMANAQMLKCQCTNAQMPMHKCTNSNNSPEVWPFAW